MPKPSVIYQCMRPSCHFRFPVLVESISGLVCPKCGGPTHRLEFSLDDASTPTPCYPVPGPMVEALLDNIRSSFNVGAMFRAADGAGVHHLHLCGITPTPDHPKVAKTALGAERVVSWTQHWDSLAAVRSSIESGMHIWALESGTDACDLFQEKIPRDEPILLVVGNEVSGVDPELLTLCEKRVFIPMLGIKRSLNVAIAFGIAIYHIRFAGRLQG